MAFHSTWIGESQQCRNQNVTNREADWKRPVCLQITKEEQVMVIDSAQGDCFDAYYKKEETGPVVIKDESLLKPLFDGSASWFT